MVDKTTVGASIAILIVIVIILTIVFIAIFSEPSQEETIKIGAILPLTGNAAYYGQVSQQGIEIAVQEFARENPNLSIELYYEDSAYTPKVGVDAYHKLRNVDGVDAVITAASHVSLAIQPLSTQDGILQMAIFSSAVAYTTPDDMSFRVTARSEIEDARLAEFITENGFERLGILYLNNDFGVSHRDSLRAELEKSSVQVIGEEGLLLEASDFRTQLSKLNQNNPDIIFMVGIASQYGLIMKQALEMGMDIQFLAMHSAEDPNLITNAGESADDLIYSYPFDASSENPEIGEFTSAYQAKYGKVPDAYAAQGYEGFRLIALAFRECGRDYSCIKAYLEGLKDFRSILGGLSFDENGDVHYEFFLKTVKNGQFVPYEG